ncbi:hypothetical protein QVA66_03325 [Staphylococcus chromogenes]|nr:hypothetical protein [Staphylococcus chromogenes]
MSQRATTTNRATRHSSATSRAGFSVWSATSIIVAALITGLLLSWNFHAIGWPFMLCFIIASLAMTLFVEIRGLFLTIAQLPLLFGIFIMGTGWLVANSNLSANADSMSKTMILSAIYPLAQYFPQLIATTVGCVIIGVLRYRRGIAKARASRRLFEEQRAQQSQADQRNRSTTRRVREMTARTRRSASDSVGQSNSHGGRVTVAELAKRAEQRRTEEHRAPGARGRAVPPRREPGESLRSMPSISEVERQRAVRRPDVAPAREETKPKRRPSLSDDLYS